MTPLQRFTTQTGQPMPAMRPADGPPPPDPEELARRRRAQQQEEDDFIVGEAVPMGG